MISVRNRLKLPDNPVKKVVNYVPITGTRGADNRYVPIIGMLCYSLLYEAIQHESTEVCYKFHTVSGVLTTVLH